MKVKHDMKVRMIPIEQITVVNSRSRGKKKFQQIVGNIASVGLKKPITLARRTNREGEVRYDLVCGQGRLEAYLALGQKEVPALIVDAEKEDLMLMSLAENIARRPYTTLDMAREIVAMRDRGYKPADIAKKVDLDPVYVNCIIRLLKQGEKRLIIAVERHQVPLSTAIQISESTDQEIQKAMTEAYAKGELRGQALMTARRIVEARRTKGKDWRARTAKTDDVDTSALVKAYKKETAKQRLVVSRAKLCENRLSFVITAVKKLLADEGFVTLLRAEGMATLPQYLSDRVNGKGLRHGA